MDYFGILKKALDITWRYKMLWVLGLFAGTATGSSSPGGTSSYSTNGRDFAPGSTDAFTRWLGDNVLLVAIVVGVLAMIGIVLWVLSVAAQGGLVHGTNEAAEGRSPSLSRLWGVGFSRWGRTFMIGFMLGLPVIVIGGVLAGVLVALGVGGAASGGSDAAVGALLGGICLILPIFVVLLIGVSVVLGIVYPLALRYGVLQDVTFGKAIRRGWDDLWAKRGAFMFWLVMLLPGLAFGFLMVLPMMLFIVPMVLLFAAQKYVIAGSLVVLMILVMMVPSAIYSTFVSSAWTVFFREMTGMEPRVAQAIPGMAGTYAPPAPPVPYAPSTPVAPPAPPVGCSPSAPPAASAGFAAPVPAEPPIVDVQPPVAQPPVPPEETSPGDA